MKEIIENAWQDRALLKDSATQQAIRQVIEDLDKGRIRVSEPLADG